MKEIDLQTKAKDAVIEMGGMAMKMSNRFLVGVPDLLFKLPSLDASFWEVKWAPRPAAVALVTVQQKRWLQAYQAAGGLSGVIYFIMKDNDMRVGMKPTHAFPKELKAQWRFEQDEFVVLPRGCKMQPFKELVLKLHANETRLKTNRTYIGSTYLDNTQGRVG